MADASPRRADDSAEDIGTTVALDPVERPRPQYAGLFVAPPTCRQPTPTDASSRTGVSGHEEMDSSSRPHMNR